MNYKTLKQTLINKKYSQDGMVAWGQVNKASKGVALGGLLGGAVGGAIAGTISAATSPYIAFSRVGTKLVITPFSDKEIDFKKAIAIDKSKISKFKISGFGFYSSFRLWTIDGKKRVYSLMQGKKDLKKIFESFGI